MGFYHTRRRSAPSLSGGVGASSESEPPPKSSSSSASSDTGGGEALTPGRTSSSSRDKRWIPTIFRRLSHPKMPDRRFSASAPGLGSSSSGRYSYAVKPSALAVADDEGGSVGSTVRETAPREMDDVVSRTAVGNTGAQTHSLEGGASGVTTDSGEGATTYSGSGAGGVGVITAIAADPSAVPTKGEGEEGGETTTTSNTTAPATMTGSSSIPPAKQEGNTNNNPIDNQNKNTATAPKHGDLSTVAGTAASSVDTGINASNTAGDGGSGNTASGRPTKSSESESDRRGGRAGRGGGGWLCNASVGMSVLCLVVWKEEGSGANGGSGVRRWRPGEVSLTVVITVFFIRIRCCDA